MRKDASRLALALILLSATTHLHASCYFDDLYTGLSLGEALTMGSLSGVGNANLSFPAVPQTNTVNVSSQNNIKRISVVGAGFVGYGFSFDPMYLGIEGFVKGANANTKLTDSANFTQNAAAANIVSSTRTELRTLEYGADLRPGVLILPELLLYARIGAAVNKLTMTSTLNIAGQNPGVTPAANIALSQSKSKKLLALRLGLGVESKINSDWGLRADYVYTYYRKMTINSSLGANIPGPPAGSANLSGSSTAKVFNHAIMLGLSYYW